MNDVAPIRAETTAYWKTLGTLLWGVVIFGVFSIAQTVGALGAGIDMSQGAPTQDQIEAMLPELVKNGDVLVMATLLGFFIAVPLMLLIIKLKRGTHLKDYFGFYSASGRDYLKWIGIMAVCVIAMGLIGEAIQEKSADAFTTGVFKTASNVPMLFVAVALLAPLFEELFFRGFLYKGLSEGKLGPVGAIVLTSLMWAVIHVQYDWFPILMIFMMGIVLGYARYKTGSIWVPIVLHALNNFASLLLVAFTTPPAS